MNGCGAICHCTPTRMTLQSGAHKTPTPSSPYLCFLTRHSFTRIGSSFPRTSMSLHPPFSRYSRYYRWYLNIRSVASPGTKRSDLQWRNCATIRTCPRRCPSCYPRKVSTTRVSTTGMSTTRLLEAVRLCETRNKRECTLYTQKEN